MAVTAMLPSLATARCFNHADRPAFAVCVSCRKAVCQSCATLWEGRHFCVDCLAGQRAGAGRRRALARTLLVVAAAAALLFVATYLRVWVGAFLAEVL